MSFHSTARSNVQCRAQRGGPQANRKDEGAMIQQAHAFVALLMPIQARVMSGNHTLAAPPRASSHPSPPLHSSTQRQATLAEKEKKKLEAAGGAPAPVSAQPQPSSSSSSSLSSSRRPPSAIERVDSAGTAPPHLLCLSPDHPIQNLTTAQEAAVLPQRTQLHHLTTLLIPKRSRSVTPSPKAVSAVCTFTPPCPVSSSIPKPLQPVRCHHD